MVRTDGIGGVVFDRYDVDDYKFVALDVPNQRVIIGHRAPTAPAVAGWSSTPSRGCSPPARTTPSS